MSGEIEKSLGGGKDALQAAQSFSEHPRLTREPRWVGHGRCNVNCNPTKKLSNYRPIWAAAASSVFGDYLTNMHIVAVDHWPVTSRPKAGDFSICYLYKSEKRV